MADFSPYDLLTADEPTAQEQAHAMAQALRQRQDTADARSNLALIASLGSNRNFGQALASNAQNMSEQAQHQQDQLFNTPHLRMSMALQRQDLTKNQADMDAAAQRRAALGDANSIPTQVRTSLAKQFGATLPEGTTGNALDDNTLGLMEKGYSARENAVLRRSLAGMGGGGGFNPVMVESAADYLAKTGGMPDLKLGKAGGAFAKAVGDVYAQKYGAERPDLASAHATYHADTGALSHEQGRADAVSSFTRTFDKNLGILEDYLNKIESSNLPIANKGYRAWQSFEGDPNLTGYKNALNTVTSELGKINSGSTGQGGVPISVLEEMQRSLPENATPRQVFEALKVYRKDSENRTAALNENVNAIKGRIGGKQAKPEQAAAPTHPQADAALQWAKDNPTDPRAVAILKKLGVQ
jgi:hypothetical protein